MFHAFHESFPSPKRKRSERFWFSPHRLVTEREGVSSTPWLETGILDGHGVCFPQKNTEKHPKPINIIKVCRGKICENLWDQLIWMWICSVKL